MPLFFEEPPTMKFWLSVLLMFTFCSCAFAAEEPIKIGGIFAITGPASWLGKPEADTAQMIAEKINAKGGIKGRKIELIVKDTQGEETRAVNAVQDLLRQNVVAIIGPSRSGTSMAVAPICESAKVPLLSCATLEQIVQGRKWVFKVPHKDSQVVERIYDAMKAKGLKKIALLSSTDGFGDGGRAKLKELAAAYGIEIVADETYGPKDTDMSAQISKIKAKNPDAVVNWSIVPAQSIVMKNAKQLGLNCVFFQSLGFANYSYVKAAGDAANGVLFPADRILVANELPDSDPQKAVLVQFKKDYEERYKEPVSTFAGHAYDSLMLVAEACEKSGATPQQIRDYIENKKGFMGISGEFNFSPDDHTGLQKDSLEMLTVKDGKFAIAK
jgi:branched-chain amino acid transport system substrate-binding protein